MTNRDFWTSRAMQVFGVSFVYALGICAMAADAANLQKIKDTFPLYWDSYESLGRQLENKEDES